MGGGIQRGSADRLVRAQWWIAGGLLAAAAVPQVRASIPGFDTLWGPIGWAAALGTLVLILPGRRLILGVASRLPSWAVLVAVAAVSLSSGLYYVRHALATGDEPHYLVMARSLWQEGDLDVVDNMQRHDYQDFSYGFQFHYGRATRDGNPYPAHSPGLPLVLAPILALGGRPACVAFLAMCLGLLAVAVQRLARKCGADREGALIAWLVAVGPPIFFFSFQVYTELPSALVIVLVLNLLLGERPGARSAVVAALLAATLPWLHVKLVLAAVGLGVVGLVRLRDRARWSFVVVGAVMAALFMGHHWWVFGSPLAAGYGRFPPRGFRGSNPLASLAGLALDREFGLLPYAPVFLLAVPGLALALGPFKRRAWSLVLVAATVLLPILPWRMWWAGQSPPARFLVPLLPLLAVTIGLHGRDLRRGLVRWLLPMLLVGATTTSWMFLAPGGPTVVGTRGDGTSVMEALGPGRQLPNVLPKAGEVERRVVGVWAAMLGLLLVLHRLARHANAVDGLFRAPLLPLVAWSLLAALVDLWARA